MSNSLGTPLEKSDSFTKPSSVKRQVTKFTDPTTEACESAVKSAAGNSPRVDVLMIGTGEYTTGYVNDKPADSDKSAGVVGLTMFDLRSRGKVSRLGLCGVNGKKFPGIRSHLQRAIGDVYSGYDLAVETFPQDTEVDPEAYRQAVRAFKKGDAAIIFTPDDTHFDIAMAAIQQGMHVLVTKPAVQKLEHHRLLHEAAQERGVLVAIEVHKRWDPLYTDARDKIHSLGPFSYLYSYMSQPKHQLETFKAWAGKSSDISYYLNSHHIDFHEWCVGETSRPSRVTAMASVGVARDLFQMENCEDTITLSVQWENIEVKESSSAVGKEVKVISTGTAVYTSSWVAPKSDVHSQQRFFYMGQKGEITMDQAHRGYSLADDTGGYRSVNPLFMKYTPTNGKFSGQQGYGYKSFEVFIDAVNAINAGQATPADYDEDTASISTTYRTTAILEAGRLSLDRNGSVFEILYEDAAHPCRPTRIVSI